MYEHVDARQRRATKAHKKSMRKVLFISRLLFVVIQCFIYGDFDLDPDRPYGKL